MFGSFSGLNLERDASKDLCLKLLIALYEISLWLVSSIVVHVFKE